jgi:hypothetical protein
VKDRASAIDAHAYVDNCLSPAERKAFEALLRQDEELRRKVDLWRTQSEAIRATFGAPGRCPQSRPANSPGSPIRNEAAEPALRLHPRAHATESAAPRWTSLLRRPATRAVIVLMGITFFSGGMAHTPDIALAATGASAFRAFSAAPAATLDFRGGLSEDFSRALGPQFSAVRLSEWATPLGWNLRGAKRVPGLYGEAILVLLADKDSRALGVLVEPLDAPASSAIRMGSLGGITVAAFTRRGFGFAVAGQADGEVGTWLAAAGFMDEGWPQLGR